MKKIISVILALLMLVAVVGCTPAEPTPSVDDNPYERVTVRVAYMPNMGGCSLFMAGFLSGAFDKYNLDIKLVEFGDGPSEIAAMASGDIDIAMIGHGAHALCCEGQAVVFYSDAIGLSSAIVANKEKGINSIADLRGQKVGYVAGTASEELLKLALSKEGMTIDDVEAINFDVSGNVTAMISGEIAAAATSQPYTSSMMAQLGDNAVILCEDRTYLDERTMMNSEICTKEFYENNYDLIVRISCALAEAADYRSANIEEVAKAVAKQTEGDEATFLTLTEECIWISGTELKEFIEDDRLTGFYANAQQAFLNSGRLTESVPVEDYVMFDAMNEALAIVYGE